MAWMSVPHPFQLWDHFTGMIQGKIIQFFPLTMIIFNVEFSRALQSSCATIYLSFLSFESFLIHKFNPRRIPTFVVYIASRQWFVCESAGQYWAFPWLSFSVYFPQRCLLRWDGDITSFSYFSHLCSSCFHHAWEVRHVGLIDFWRAHLASVHLSPPQSSFIWLVLSVSQQTSTRTNNGTAVGNTMMSSVSMEQRTSVNAWGLLITVSADSRAETITVPFQGKIQWDSQPAKHVQKQYWPISRVTWREIRNR